MNKNGFNREQGPRRILSTVCSNKCKFHSGTALLGKENTCHHVHVIIWSEHQRATSINTMALPPNSCLCQNNASRAIHPQIANIRNAQRRKKSAKQDKTSQQHLPPLLSSYPFRPWKHAATSLKKTWVSMTHWASLLSSDIAQALIYSDLCPAGITTSRRTDSAPLPPCAWSYSVA